MRDNAYPLSFDPTGTLDENFVIDEEHRLDGEYQKGKRAFVMDKGFFYTDSLVVRDEGTKVLTKGIDYRVLFLHSELTVELGRSVAGLIVIINPAIANRVYADARMVGGEYTRLGGLVQRLLNTLDNHERAVNFINVHDTPDTYKPVRHYQSIADTYGWETIRKRLIDINYWLKRRSDNMLHKDFDYIQQGIAYCNEAISNIETMLAAHKADKNNPHQLTLKQMLLELYANRIIVTREKLYSANRYRDFLTPAATARYIEDTSLKTLQTHKEDMHQPHDTTLDDINAYNADFINKLPEHYYLEKETVHNAHQLEGKPLTDYINDLRQEGDYDHVVGRPVDLSLLGSGKIEDDSVLLGDGTWMHFRDVMAKYAPKRPQVFTLGHMGDAKSDEARLNAEKQAAKLECMDGSVALWHEQYTVPIKIDTISKVVTGEIPAALIKENGQWRRLGSINHAMWHFSEKPLLGGGLTSAQIDRNDLSVTVMPGLYSVFMVGGGGAGNGGNGMCGAGGGSGYAIKTRIRIEDGSNVQLIVGTGGGLGGITGNYGENGKPSLLIVNGVEVLRAEGGHGAYEESTAMMHGGTGASGGGSANGTDYIHGKHVHSLGTPGNGGWNGGDGGSGAGGGFGSGDVIGGGSGMGSNYYSNVLRSIDPELTHGFDVNNISHGGNGWSFSGTNNPSNHATFGGGGGGVGLTQFCANQSWNGTVINCTGLGHGAGGGGRQRGIAGVISIVRIGD